MKQLTAVSEYRNVHNAQAAEAKSRGGLRFVDMKRNHLASTEAVKKLRC